MGSVQAAGAQDSVIAAMLHCLLLESFCCRDPSAGVGRRTWPSSIATIWQPVDTQMPLCPCCNRTRDPSVNPPR